MFTKIPKLKFVVASNHLTMIKKWLKQENYDRYFNDLVISEDVKYQKPEPEFYRVIIHRLGENPEEVLFIDDREENLEAARKAGFQTLTYDGKRLLSAEINSYLHV